MSRPVQQPAATPSSMAVVVTTAPETADLVPAHDEANLPARLLETLSRDVVYRLRLVPTRAFEYISPSCTLLSGYTPDEFRADADIAFRLVHRDDVTVLQAMLSGIGGQGPYVLRWVRRDGTIAWTEHRVTQVRDGAGAVVALEGSIRDVTETALAREAVGAGERGMRSFMDAAPHLGLIVDALGRLTYVNPAFTERTGIRPEEAMGRDWAAVLLRDPRAHSNGRDFLGLAGGWANRREVISPVVLRDGRQHAFRWLTLGLFDTHGHLSGVAALAEDLTEERDRGRAVAQLIAAVEHASDAVVIAETDGSILYVNPAFERATGYERNEVIGRNPRMLQSGHQSPAFYRAMWFRLTRGRTWFGELVNRRKDGTLLILESTITPVRDDDGTVVAYVSVARDVTRMRELRASLDDERRRHELLGSTLQRLAPRATVAGTCEDIATVLRELPGVIAAGVVLPDEEAFRLQSLVSSVPTTVLAGNPIPSAMEARLTDPACPDHFLVEVQRPTPDDEAAPEHDGGPCEAAAAGIYAVLFVPIRWDGAVVGALVVGGTDPDGADLLALVPDIAQVASVARSLVGPKAVTRLARGQVRERIRRIIEQRAFHMVFQPIVNLETNRPIGFEALARFDDWGGPVQVFADAELSGLTPQLEKAVIEEALREAERLPRDAWISLNVSPTTACDGVTLPEVLGTQTRRIVIEITEHMEVDNYDTLRATLAALGPNVSVAVDDTGAGTANFRHLVELHPDFIKLDMSFVRDIDRDFTRQALVMGLKQFARVSGRVLIAEGIETEEERETLRRLEVRFGQGYLLGMPAAVEVWTGVETDRLAA